jgi:hypothetical protein
MLHTSTPTVVLRNVNSAPASAAIGSSSKLAASTRRQTGNTGTQKIDRNIDVNDPFSALSEAVSEQHHSEISLSLGRSNGSMILPHSGQAVPSSVSPPRMSIIRNLKALSPRHGGAAQVHNLAVVDVTGTSCHAQQQDDAAVEATATATADYTTDASYDATAHLLVSCSNGEITVSDDTKFNQANTNNMELGVR